jgi:hypothetical protein
MKRFIAIAGRRGWVGGVNPKSSPNLFNQSSYIFNNTV